MPAFTRGPALLAQSAATLANLAPGRFALGIGSSSDVIVEGYRIGDAQTANVARVVRESAIYLANFRGAQEPTPFVPPGHWPVLAP